MANVLWSTLAILFILTVSPIISATPRIPQHEKPHGHGSTSDPNAPVCPVTGEKVADMKTAAFSTYNGKKYFFCCPECKPMFDKNPAKYVAKPKTKKPAA